MREQFCALAMIVSPPLSAGHAQKSSQRESRINGLQRGIVAGRVARPSRSILWACRCGLAEDFAKLGQTQHSETGEELVRQTASYKYQDADSKTIQTVEHRARSDATSSASDTCHVDGFGKRR
jgi:hypothetical protein